MAGPTAVSPFYQGRSMDCVGQLGKAHLPYPALAATLIEP
jgi:hypothetical protein